MADYRRELKLIIELCRELAKLSLDVGMSDARPAVTIRGHMSNAPLVITVDDSGEFFEWRDGKNRYPVADPAGAATQVVEQLHSQIARPDGAA